MTFAFAHEWTSCRRLIYLTPPIRGPARGDTENPTFVSGMQDSYVSVFGFGNFDSRLQPQNGSVSRVMILHNKTEFPVCASDEVLFADFLVFQISLTSGMLTYTDAKSYGSTVVNETTNETSARI